jgi:hypothetical protein
MGMKKVSGVGVGQTMKASSLYVRPVHFPLVQMTHRGRIDLTTEVREWNKVS